jgi:hypothetical protein
LQAALVAMTSCKVPALCVKLGAVLAVLAFGATPACACGWWWGCSEGYGYRQPARVYGYTARRSAPMRIPSRAELRGVPRIPGGDVGLQAPVLSSTGIMQSAMPARGPTLFGPAPGAPAYAYSGTSVRGWQRSRRLRRAY